jgi:glycerol-1-phosphate dehydrogenase [NAD(P)+]
MLKEVERLLRRFDPSMSYDYERVVTESGIEVEFASDDDELVDLMLPTPATRFLVTDSYLLENFVRPLESKYSKKFDGVRVHAISNEDYKEVKLVLEKMRAARPLEVIGFGGGRPLDVAKMIAKEAGVELISVPTTPSHDGIVSGTSSLVFDGKKRSVRSKLPSRVIFPIHYLRTAPSSLRDSGKCDILVKPIVWQDLSLAQAHGKEELEARYMIPSLLAVKELLKGRGIDSLVKSLFLSGRSMESTSKYGSQSEHEVEKALRDIAMYPHGQLVGSGGLVSTKVYEIHASELPGQLFFDARKLYHELVRLFKSMGVYEHALRPLMEMWEEQRSDFIARLRRVSEVRPERYNLWNVVDSRRVDWKSVIEGILP